MAGEGRECAALFEVPCAAASRGEATRTAFRVKQLTLSAPAFIRRSFQQLQALGQPRRQLLGGACRRRRSRSGGGSGGSGGSRRVVSGCSCRGAVGLEVMLLRCSTGLVARLLHQEARPHCELPTGAARGSFSACYQSVGIRRGTCIAGTGVAAALQVGPPCRRSAAAAVALMSFPGGSAGASIAAQGSAETIPQPDRPVRS